MGKDNYFYKIIRECSDELNIKLDMLSYNYIYELKKDNKIRHIIGNRFDLNNEAAADIACDKYATYEVLKNNHIPVIEYVHIFNPKTRYSYIPNGGNEKFFKEYLKKHKTLVVKPNDGKAGVGVALCNNIDEVNAAVNNIFSKKNDCVICPYYDIDREYRSFYLDGEVCLIYGKEKPSVIGDGVSNLETLINKLNLYDKDMHFSKINMNYVPKDGEKIELSWKFNLSWGAIPHVLDEGILHDRIKELAIKSGKILNLTFAMVDIIHTKDDKLYVIEINSSVGPIVIENGHNMMKEMYKKAILKMFKE